MIARIVKPSPTLLLLSLMLTGVAGAQTAAAPVKFDSGTISGLPARNIGSAR